MLYMKNDPKYGLGSLKYYAKAVMMLCFMTSSH